MDRSGFDADITISIRDRGNGGGTLAIAATKMPPEALIFMLRMALKTAEQKQGKPDSIIEVATQRQLRGLLELN